MLRIYKIISLIALLSWSVNYAYGQNTIIKGTVRIDKTGKPAETVTVSVQLGNNTPIRDYTLTDKDGRFELKFTGAADSLTLTATGFDVKRKSFRIANRSQTLDMVLEESITTIKEVVITAPKIRQRGNTLSYIVSQFTDIGDRSIADVLKKMPGIKVNDQDLVKYQDKPINKFYIEEMDMLQGRYGLATKNIEAKDVATVEVYENHQPIKALKDKGIVEEAAINIKLKDSAKGVWTVNAQAGAGLSPLLLSNELVAMRFAGARQNMIIYKGDNSGKNIQSELTQFYSSGQSGLSNMLAVRQPYSPAISLNRYNFNDTHLGTINDLTKLGKDITMTTHIDYVFDNPEKKSFSKTEYFLGGDSIVILPDDAWAAIYMNKLRAGNTIESNKDKFFLRNEINFEGEWTRTFGINDTGDTITQKLSNHSYKVGNSLRLVKSSGKFHYTVNSNIGFHDFDQSLLVTPLLYEDLFGIPTIDADMVQKVDGRRFYAFNNIYNHFSRGIWQFGIGFEANADLQKMSSVLNITEDRKTYDMGEEFKNDISWNMVDLILNPIVTFRPNSSLNASLNLPVKYSLLFANDRIPGKKK